VRALKNGAVNLFSMAAGPILKKYCGPCADTTQTLSIESVNFKRSTRPPWAWAWGLIGSNRSNWLKAGFVKLDPCCSWQGYSRRVGANDNVR